ncbi:rhamnulose-1-phosphate aldolase [uncultured Draconibacterium sp.]|uniref:rhamnulose-1-phosphate aldolase n=1 Tax=uncultured Draconibacterium sp. TaxID=1573823 RepID=UPI00325FEB76
MVKTTELPESVQAEIIKIKEIAAYLWERGWAERNAGNISVNLTEYCVPADFVYSADEEPFFCPPEMADSVLFITGSGCRLRRLITKPEEAAAIVHINKKANAYRLIWGGEKQNFAPSSELISHLQLHAFNCSHRPLQKTIIHTHPSELIVLSHHPLFGKEEQFNYSLWKMCPEIRLYVPNGVSCAPYARYGTEELARLTIQGFQTRDIVLWEKHGAVATGTDAEEAFDFLDVANKAAKMLLMAWSAGFEPAGLSANQLDELGRTL